MESIKAINALSICLIGFRAGCAPQSRPEFSLHQTADLICLDKSNLNYVSPVAIATSRDTVVVRGVPSGRPTSTLAPGEPDYVRLFTASTDRWSVTPISTPLRRHPSAQAQLRVANHLRMAAADVAVG